MGSWANFIATTGLTIAMASISPLPSLEQQSRAQLPPCSESGCGRKLGRRALDQEEKIWKRYWGGTLGPGSQVAEGFGPSFASTANAVPANLADQSNCFLTSVFHEDSGNYFAHFEAER